MDKVGVVIVGAGPSGLATSVCLSYHSISNVILEKENCYASLWKNRTYDRLNIHLGKSFCSLPYMPQPASNPTFMSRDSFIQYLDDYVSKFHISPRLCLSVQSAFYDESMKIWRIEAENTLTMKTEIYSSKFLVVATGENSEAFIPDLPGMDSFKKEIVHSSNYKSGERYKSKEVLVVGCGNSGMEIAYDLSVFGAHPSIVVRSPLHIVNKEIIYFGMLLLKYLPVSIVDTLTKFLAKLKYGDLSSYGIHQPKKGPFHLKATMGRSPVIDVGTVLKIRAGEIQVLPEVSCINNAKVVFKNGLERDFDAIVFATGYKSSATKWLKDYKYIYNEDGMPKKSFSAHWKGENGLYCAGFSRSGIAGLSMDAKAIANDIKMVISGRKENQN